MAKYIELECAHCGKKFKRELHKYKYAVKNGTKTFVCSVQCQQDIRKSRLTKTCAHCGKEFEVTTCRKDAIFCSTTCAGIYHTLQNGHELKEKRVCQHCGKEFLIKPSARRKNRGYYCSRKCYYAVMKEKNKIKVFDDYAQIVVNSSKYGVHTVLIDKESLEKLKNRTVGVRQHHTGSFYAFVYIKEQKKTIPLHRFLTNCPNGMVVDHLNHCTLDNRKSNLRICTAQENASNQLKDDVLDIVKEYYRMKYYYKDFASA